MLNIRPATPDDVPLILQFIRDLAEYEREPQAAVATAADLLRDGWGPQPKFRCVIADWNSQPAAFAFFFYNYSTWQGRPGLYLEDLFVRDKFRRRGLARTLLATLAKVCVDNGYTRLAWEVLDWNVNAIALYDAVGGRPQTDWITYRVSGPELSELADESS